jgi:uncharacterized protein YndB with AHSA1/START domain
MNDDARGIYLDTFLPHPPRKVWRALTEPDLIARWLMPNGRRLAGRRRPYRAGPRALALSPEMKNDEAYSRSEWVNRTQARPGAAG